MPPSLAKSEIPTTTWHIMQMLCFT